MDLLIVVKEFQGCCIFSMHAMSVSYVSVLDIRTDKKK